MTAYLLRRTGTSIIIVLGVTLVIFALLHAIFPSPAIVVLGPRANRTTIAAWNASHGFDSPWIVQYLRYIWGLLHGNLGYSYKLNETVLTLFSQRWLRSLYLSGASLVIAIVLAVPLGIYQAIRRNTIGDHFFTTLALIGFSMPTFFLGLILIQVFSQTIPLFNYQASQSTNIFAVMADWHSMTLPIATLVLVTVAFFSRFMRSSAMDTLAQDYIKAARAKGLPERLVLLRHLVRNSILPIITLVGLFLPVLLAGNLVTETVFNYQGLGLLFFDSLGNADYNVLMAYTLVAAILTVLGNYLADIALTIADPRIRLV